MLLTLPNELLLEVLEYIPNASDVYCLLLTTKQISGLVQPALDKAAIRIQEAAKEKRLPLLHFACFENDITIAKLALKLEPGCINSFNGRRGSALHLASWNGYGKMVRFLLANGADPNSINPLSHVRDAPLDMALDQMFLPLPFSTPAGNHAEIAQQLLLAGANPNKLSHSGDNALIKAASTAVPELITTILATGVVDINSHSSRSETALHLAAWMQGDGATKVVQVLLEAGIDVNAVDGRGETALFSSSSKDISALLIQYGADVNIANHRGQTVLHRLANSKNDESAIVHIAEFLKSEFVIDVSRCDCFGYSAIDYAMYNNNSGVVKLLKDYMASLEKGSEDDKSAFIRS